MTFEPWTPPPSERDILIDKVKHGELTPKQVGLEASRLGLEPFEFYPNPEDFDPMREPTWSLPMALAWIMWRTPDAVREMWDDYRKEFRFWVAKSWRVPGGPIYEGHFLERKDRAEFLDLAIAAGDQPPIARVPEAFQLLRIGAQRAAWKATGLPTDGGHRREIWPFEWVDFRIFERFRGAGVRITHGTGYDDCCFPVAELVKSFPALSIPPARRGRSPEVPWDRVKREFLKLMEHHGDIHRDDPEWNSKEKLIAALQVNEEVSRSALQPKVNEWLEEWRRSRKATK